MVYHRIVKLLSSTHLL